MIYSGAMTVQKNKNSDIKDYYLHAKQGMEFLKNYNQLIEFCARAKTLNEILTDNNIRKKIDFLSLDTEGVELEVLKGLDFDEFKFKYILVESRDIDRIVNFFNTKQYVLEEQLTEIDFLFHNKNY
jgi:FkbM family methyltransferase